MVTLVCQTCEKEFEKKHKNYKFCSRECYYEMKRIRGDRVIWTKEMKKNMSKKYSGKGNPNFGNPRNIKGYTRPGLRGKNHPMWKGGCYTSKNGDLIHIIDGKDVPEYRLIMEKKIGRKLTDKDIVHHINGNHNDNRIENLKICTRAEHINLHRDDLKCK